MQPRRDVFLSHASEDKAQYVAPLAEELDKRGISYWLDEAEIKWGDRITTKVDEGLAQSRYVVVFLSDSFIGKGWPEAELGSALNHETSNGQTTVLPLIIADPDKVFQRYSLLRDKFYIPWDKGLTHIGDRLSKLLNFTPQQDDTDAQESAMTEPENGDTPQEVTTPAMPPLVETSVHFSGGVWLSYEHLRQRLFAIITEWVDFEDVQSTSMSLRFPGGVLNDLGDTVVLTLSPGLIPLHQILTELDQIYSAIEFRTSAIFDFGELSRRSRNGVRNITLMSPDSVTLTLPVQRRHLELRVENSDQGGSITVAETNNNFRPTQPPVPYTTAIQYLLEDPPPTRPLIVAASLALGLKPPPQED